MVWCSVDGGIEVHRTMVRKVHQDVLRWTRYEPEKKASFFFWQTTKPHFVMQTASQREGDYTLKNVFLRLLVLPAYYD